MSRPLRTSGAPCGQATPSTRAACSGLRSCGIPGISAPLFWTRARRRAWVRRRPRAVTRHPSAVSARAPSLLEAVGRVRTSYDLIDVLRGSPRGLTDVVTRLTARAERHNEIVQTTLAASANDFTSPVSRRPDARRGIRRSRQRRYRRRGGRCPRLRRRLSSRLPRPSDCTSTRASGSPGVASARRAPSQPQPRAGRAILDLQARFWCACRGWTAWTRLIVSTLYVDVH